MELKDLEVEAIKLEGFKAGYMAALQMVATRLELEKKAELKQNEVAEDKQS